MKKERKKKILVVVLKPGHKVLVVCKHKHHHRKHHRKHHHRKHHE